MAFTFADIIATSGCEENFLEIFENAFSEIDEPILTAHRVILSACYKNPELSPKIPKIKSNTPEALAQTWLRKYHDSFKNRISQRISQTPKTVADPIINTIISARLTMLTEEHLEQIKYAHRLSMSAENIQGLLLEEFLAEELAAYDWYCCWGEVIRHVDFCNTNGSLLQVKNRSNTENSSSSTVRNNQPIDKWYRVDANTGNYKWSYFNDKYQTDRFSEENFVAFVQRVLAENPDALAIEENNPWKSLFESSD